jgi:hypothetical protein
MADILYKIVYEDDDFRTEQHIVKIGTKRDRIAFITTEESEEYIPDGKKVALQRHDHRDPFKEKKEAEVGEVVMPEVYIVPVGERHAHYFDAVKTGGRWEFHLNCGYADPDGTHFEHRQEGRGVLFLNARPRRKHHGDAPKALVDNKPSLPFPG